MTPKRNHALKSAEGQATIQELLQEKMRMAIRHIMITVIEEQVEMLSRSGETRYTSGSTATNYRYTGQRNDPGLGGLMFYNARWYDPALARFAQADTMIPGPGNPLAWDRYAYAQNNALKYNDPSGHWINTPNGHSEFDNSLDTDWTWSQKYNVVFTNLKYWTYKKMIAVMQATTDVGNRLASVMNLESWQAFRAVYGKMEYEMRHAVCDEGCLGRTISAHEIWFYDQQHLRQLA